MRPIVVLCAGLLAGFAVVGHAQDTMTFRPVPPESADQFDRRVRISTRGPGIVVSDKISRSGEITRVGSDIHIKADEEVHGDVVAIRGDVRVDGHVYGSVMAMGGDVELGPTAVVEEDVAS